MRAQLEGRPDPAGAAGPLEVPVLLTYRDDLPAATAERLGADRDVLVVGGPAAVAEEVVGEVDRLAGTVERLAGATRYATSAVVAQRALARGLSPAVTHVATGTDYPDALVAGAAVGAVDGVLLLVDGGDPDGSPETLQVLADVAGDVRELRILGGEAAIGPPTRARLTAASAESGHGATARPKQHGFNRASTSVHGPSDPRAPTRRPSAACMPRRGRARSSREDRADVVAIPVPPRDQLVDGQVLDGEGVVSARDSASCWYATTGRRMSIWCTPR